MRKSVTLLLILVFLIASSIVTPLPVKAEPKTIVVPDDYPTIQEAIDNASAGDRVFVKKGIYNIGIVIDKSISLIGEERETTIIRPSSYSRYWSWEYGIQITADNVTISGFTIDGAVYDVTIQVRGFPIGWESITESSIKNVNDGIILGDSKGVRIFSNIIINNERAGVSVSGENNQVYQNNITGNDAGVVTNADTIARIFKPSCHVISENMIARNNVGISVSSSNTTVLGNEVVNNYREGISVGNCFNVTVSGNIISNNGGSNQTNENRGGLSLSYWGPCYVYGNNITHNQGNGISFGEYCSNSVVWNNNITNNDIGIIEYNVRDVGEGNKLFQNNIIDNQQQVAINQTLDVAEGTGTDIVALDNGKVGNYWSDYLTRYPNATEVDSSGIGNMPYVIDDNNIDHYPLMQPVNISVTTLEPEPFPVVPVAAVSVFVVAAAVGVGLLFYFKKRKH
jgi:parallel beta-helix repeat protein